MRMGEELDSSFDRGLATMKRLCFHADKIGTGSHKARKHWIIPLVASSFPLYRAAENPRPHLYCRL